LAGLGLFVLGIVFVVLRRAKVIVPRRTYPQYVVKSCSGLPANGRLVIEVDAVGPFPASATLTPYFQRAGDDWSARGEYEAYRWWASFATIKLVPGQHRIEVSFADNWTAVLRSSRQTNPDAFAEALKKAARVGFTIGDSTGLGHGDNPKGAISDYRIIVLD
jgi:hypothetical protein